MITQRKIDNAKLRAECGHLVVWSTTALESRTRHRAHCDTCGGWVASILVDNNWKLGRIRVF